MAAGGLWHWISRERSERRGEAEGRARNLIAAAALLAASPGCAERACVQWGPNDGACPTREEALAFMTGSSASCGPAKVISVDSDGDWDGTACCYDVTENDELDGEVICGSSVGAGPVGATAVTAGGSSGGFCGDGFCDVTLGEACDSCGDCGVCGCQLGADNCVGCSESVTFPECADPRFLCSESVAILDALVSCICQACPEECGPNLCSGGSADDTCAVCAQSSSACQRAISACVNDISE